MKLYPSLLLASTALTASVANGQTVTTVTPLTPLPDPVQTYFVPLPEPQLNIFFEDLNANAVSGPVSTVISVAIAADNTVIYYDHWEDGYEANAMDFTQPTTEIWGDRNLANGAPPGVTDPALDVLNGGTAVVLENDVALPRDITNILYDGRDRIQSSLPIAVTRFAFPESPGSLMAGALEVFNNGQWGRRFIAPVGKDTINRAGTFPFELTNFFVMAGEDNTEVKRNGIVISTLNAGESEAFEVNQGDVVTSDRRIQVDLLAGDIGDTYELRWYAQVDADDWTNEYISPVAETRGNTGYWFYNPSPSPITINYEGGNTNSGSLTVAGNAEGFIATCTSGSNCVLVGTLDVENNNRYSGVRFSSMDGNFYAFAQIDANGGGQIYDWGFPMIPTAQLTSQALVGLGRGCTDDCLPLNDFNGKERSVVWVTPIADTTIYVDYDGDNVFDDSYVVTALNSVRLIDSSDNDMTGAIIASITGAPVSGQPNPNGAPVRIAVVWGQDPPRSLSGDFEALDLGTAVLPLANPDVNKEVVSVTNPDGTIDPLKIVDEVGDIINYQIIISNVGFAELSNLVVTDPLIQNQAPPGVPTLTGPVESKPNSPLILERGETWTYTGDYTVTASDMSSNGGGDGQIENSVSVATDEFPKVSVEVETPIFYATVSGNVKEDINADDVGEVDLKDVPISLSVLIGGTYTVLETTLTDSDGNYKFINLGAGIYRVNEENLAGYLDVTDSDLGDLNEIDVNGGLRISGGFDYEDNDFVDERPATISGSVKDDSTAPLVAVIRLSQDGVVLRTTLTGADGTYLFDNVVPGSYVVEEVNPTDYVDVSDQDNSPDGDAGEDTVVDSKIAVSVVSAETDADNDFVDKLKPGTISGIVTDDEGNPLAGAIITLKDSANQVVGTPKTTGADGKYKFSNIVPGSYTVEEQNPTGYPTDLKDGDESNDAVPDPDDGVLTADNTIAVVLQPGEDDEDNNFQDGNNGKITGTVKDDDDVAIANVLITLLKDSDDSVVATTLTDATGSYAFDDVEPGAYKVSELNLPEFPGDVSDQDTSPDTVGGSDPTDSNTAIDNLIGVNLAPAETDSGNDFVDSDEGEIRGTVTSSDGTALNTVLLELKTLDGTVVTTTRTNGLGEYVFQNVDPGDYIVVETNPVDFPVDILDQDRIADTVPDSVDSNTTVDNTVGVNLKPGEVDAGNDFVDGKFGAVSGFVFDDQRQPLGSVTIELQTLDGTTVATTTTDPVTGFYIFNDVVPGDYQVKETNPEGYDTDVSDQDEEADDSPDAADSVTLVDNLIGVTVLPGETDSGNNFVDSDNGSISGNVSEDQGAPLAGVNVTLVTEGGAFVLSTLTDSNGNYKFTDVETGNYFVLETNPPEYPSNVKDEDSTPDGDTGDSNKNVDNSIPVTLRRSEDDTGNDFVDSNNGSISGTVLDDEGNPLSTTLNLEDASGTVIANATTNVNGEYSFNELEPGVYTVVETNPPGYPKDISDQDEIADATSDPGDTDTAVDNRIVVTLLAGESDAGNNFVDSNDGSISGNVKSDDGNFLENVNITLQTVGGEIVATTLTDVNGNYTFSDVEPGGYVVVEINPPGYPSDISDEDNSDDGDEGDKDSTVDNTIPVFVQPGEDDTDNDFVDDNDGAISGTVKDDNGRPLKDVLITLFKDGVVVEIVTTNIDGAYTFSNVEPGTYTIEETNPAGYRDVSDQDDTDDNDPNDNDKTVDNTIEVVLTPGELDADNNFVDTDNGSISGGVTDDDDVPLTGVLVELQLPDGTVVATTVTDTSGLYNFTDVEPDDYVLVETNPPGYPRDVSDFDSTPDDDADPGESVVNADNKIPVRLQPGENDGGNNFKDNNDGSIAGIVLNDEGEVLVGVTLKLQDTSGTVVRTTMTDDNGLYNFTDVEPGVYVVNETNPVGYPRDVSDQDNSNDGELSDSDTTVDNLIGVTLEAGENDNDNDFVDSDNGDITGSVKDDGGNPIPGVSIQLQRIVDANTTTVLGNTVTDSSGLYSFNDLEPGNYRVVETNLATFPIDISDEDTSPDDTTDTSKAVDNIVSVRLSAGEVDAGNDFVDSNKGKITGTVTSDEGTALSGVKIELKLPDGTVVSTTTTNGAGEYFFDKLEPGEYSIVETNPVLYPANLLDQDTIPDDIPDAADSNTAADNVIGVTLQPGETDAGNNFVDSDNGSISGTVTDDDGKPLSGVTVTLQSPDGATTFATITTDENGAYSFPDVEPGDYKVVETNPTGYLTDVSDGDIIGDGDTTDGDLTPDNEILVTVAPSESDDGNNFVDSNKGSISGTVTDDAANKLFNVTIDLKDGTTTISSTKTDTDGNYIFSNVSPGEYTVIETNPPGYPSNVKDQDSTPDGDAGDTDTVVDNSIPVTLDPSEDDTGNDFVDSNNGSISGTVKDDDGNPLAGVELVLQDSNGDEIDKVTTNANGEYVFNEVEPGTYTIIETNPVGYDKNISDRDEEIDAVPDPTDNDDTVDNKIVVTLQAGESDGGNNFVDSNDGSISGVVETVRGKKLSGVTVQLQWPNGTLIQNKTTDALGFYKFAEVEPGDYVVVEINPDDYPSSFSDQDTKADEIPDQFDSDTTVDDTIKVTVRSNEDDEGNDFVDTNLGAIAGTVKNDNGAPLSNVKVVLKFLNGTILMETRTNLNGNYTFNDMEPGEYIVEEVNPVGFRDVSDQDDSNDGDTNDGDTAVDNQILVTLLPSESDYDNNFVDTDEGSVSGGVTDDKDVPLVGVTIELQYPNGTVVATTVTDSNGVYNFTGVEPNDYVLVETNPPGYPKDVSDFDSTPDDSPDAGEGVQNADNRIPVTVRPGENDDGNSFKDSNNGSISGSVLDDQDNVLSGVTIELLDSTGAVVSTVITDENGLYNFTEVEPGMYVVNETNPVGYPRDVSDQDGSNDGDATDNTTTVDNRIGVTLEAGEDDKNNDFVDSNNGDILGSVKDDNGNPIPGVSIQLQRIVDGNTTEVAGNTVTDDDGLYSFNDLEPGNYRVVETNLDAYPGDVSDQDTTNDNDGADGDKVVDNIVGVTLEAGEVDDGNDFVDSDNGAISGKVTGDDGSALNGVTIELKYPNGTVLLTTTTNGDGIYIFENLEPGDYNIVETNPEAFPVNILDQDQQSDDIPDTADTDTVADNVIGVTLRPGETDAGNNFVDGNNGSISGSVKDDDGNPIPGVTVTLQNPDGTVTFNTTTTDETGSYSFPNVEPGDYSIVETTPAGYTDVSDQDEVADTDPDAADADTTVDDKIGVTVNPGEADTGNNFVDSNKGSISGNVTDDAGNKLFNVTIELKDGTTTVATTTTDIDGKYTFADVSPGVYSVIETNPPGYPSSVKDQDDTPDDGAIDADTTVDNSIPVVLNPSEDDEDNNFVDSNNGSISGSVKDDDGNPLEGVTLVLKDANGVTVGTVTTNGNGEYVFSEVDPGSYTIEETNPPGYPDNVSDKDNVPDANDPFDTAPDALAVDNKIGVTLVAGGSDTGNDFVDSNDGSITGTVTSDNGVKLLDVVLQLFRRNETTPIATKKTDINGFYSFTGVEPGDYDVIEIQPNGFPSSISDQDTIADAIPDEFDSDTTVDNKIAVTVQPGEKDEGNDFVDSDNGSISGTVKDDNGKPLVGVTINLKDSSGTVIDTVLTIASGYTFNSVEPGTYTVEEINPDGYPIDISDQDESADTSGADTNDGDTTVDNKIEVILTAGEADTGNNFVDSNKGSVTGGVTDDDGSPLPGVTLELQYPNGTVVSTVTTDENGVYNFTGVDPGDYVIVEINPPGYPRDVSDYDTTPDDTPDTDEGNTPGDNRIPVTVGPGETDGGNNFMDSNDGSISGTVLDDEGKVLVGVTLNLQDPNGTVIQTVTTNENGVYNFTDVEPGVYVVQEINPDGYPRDVSDQDNSNDGDPSDSVTTVDSLIGVTVEAGENDKNNDFVDSNNGDITGSVKDDKGNPIEGVSIQLQGVGGVVINTTVTGPDGLFSFLDQEPGNYTVVQSNIAAFPENLSDQDSTPDGDIVDSDTVVDNSVGVTLQPGEVDDGNDFVDSNNGEITGTVTDDDGAPIPGVPLTLLDSDNNIIATTTSGTDGVYVFDNVEPGDYTIVSENLPEYPDNILDQDQIPDGTPDAGDSNTTADNIIAVTIQPGERDTGNNFVDGNDGSISGTVKDDDGNPLPRVTVTLQSPDGSITYNTTQTLEDGSYIFPGVEPGDYKVVETNPSGYNTDISDQDEDPDAIPDAADSITTVDNEVGVTLQPGEADTGNNFVDSNKGTVTGGVTSDTDDPLPNVKITLSYPNGTVFAVTATDSDGVYTFDGVPPGDYVLTEVNPDGYPADMSDGDSTPDGDEGDDDDSGDNTILVTIRPSETDDGNNFVDIFASAVPSVMMSMAPSNVPSASPVTSAPITPSPVSAAPIVAPTTPAPITMAPIPKAPPGDFCEKATGQENCDTCAPYRSIDYCKPEESFATLIQNRTSKFRNDPQGVASDGYWFHYLEDKVAAYLLSAELNIAAPEIFCCVTNANDLGSCLETSIPTDVDGVVIKATNFHSSQGVYVLVEDPDPSKNGTIDLLTGMSMSYGEVVSALNFMQATKIIVEEFIGTDLPTEYKFHVMNGVVEAIDIIDGRGTDCPCYAVVDADMNEVNRLDRFGCFEPAGIESVEIDTQCTSIDFTTGARRAGPVKKDLNLCANIPSLDDCLKNEMTKIALDLAARIGVYMRVDMFVAGGKVYVQEYTTNHMNGLRHCAAKFDATTGCVDSCFLGRAWDQTDGVYGGSTTTAPVKLNGFLDLTPQEQCDLLTGVEAPSHASECGSATQAPVPGFLP